MKCQSFQPADQTKFQDEFAEEIYIQYKSALVCIAGFNFFQVLRERRSHLARGGNQLFQKSSEMFS